MSILVDSRVGSSEYLEPIKSRVNGQAQLATLDSGDIAFEGKGKDGSSVIVGLEIKTVGDALSSMRSGRYVEQMQKMQQDYDVCYLLIQGSYAPDEAGFLTVPARGGWSIFSLQTREQKEKGINRHPFMYAELDRFLCSLEVIENIIVRKASTKLDAAIQIVDLYTWWQRDFASHDSTKMVKIQSSDSIYKKGSTLRMMAAQIPHIGWGLSEHVEKRFKSAADMANALPTEWRSITWESKGGRKMSIGEKTAVAIYGALHGKEEKG